MIKPTPREQAEKIIDTDEDDMGEEMLLIFGVPVSVSSETNIGNLLCELRRSVQEWLEENRP